MKPYLGVCPTVWLQPTRDESESDVTDIVPPVLDSLSESELFDFNIPVPQYEDLTPLTSTPLRTRCGRPV